MSKYIVFAGIGFELIGLIILSVYAGEAFEKHWPSKGLWVAGLIVGSLIGWMIHLIYMLKGIKKSDPSDLDKVP